jgi:hypothetical protein
MYENKLLFDNFNKDQENKTKQQLMDSTNLSDTDINAMPDIDDLELMNPKEDKEELKTYSVTIKNPNLRPKSSSYIDWRGQIKKPSSAVHKTSKYFC